MLATVYLNWWRHLYLYRWQLRKWNLSKLHYMTCGWKKQVTVGTCWQLTASAAQRLTLWALEEIFYLKKYFFADNNNKRKIAEVIKYVKIRRVDHFIWGVIPTDLKLLVSVVSVSVSYLIIIIQLTHVYD